MGTEEEHQNQAAAKGNVFPLEFFVFLCFVFILEVH